MGKYKFTGKTTEIVGTDGEKHTLHQIQATKEFWNVEPGDIGGWIEKEENLSQEDDAWVKGDAKVFENARVEGDAVISGQAEVLGKATVRGNAKVYGNACVLENASVAWNSKVCGDAIIRGAAEIASNATICGQAVVSEHAQVYGYSHIWGSAYVGGKAHVSGTASVGGNAIVRGNASVIGDTRLSGKIIVQGNSCMNTLNIWHTEGVVDYDALIECENGLVVFKNIGKPHGVLCFYKGESGKIYTSITHHFDGAYFVGTIEQFSHKVQCFYGKTSQEDIFNLAMKIAKLKLR